MLKINQWSHSIQFIIFKYPILQLCLDKRFSSPTGFFGLKIGRRNKYNIVLRYPQRLKDWRWNLCWGLTLCWNIPELNFGILNFNTLSKIRTKGRSQESLDQEARLEAHGEKLWRA